MSEIEYNSKMNNLFERWKIARPEYIAEQNSFTIDGIMNYDAWINSKPRILFLLKENHDADYNPCDGITVENTPFSSNIARWRHVLRELYIDSKQELVVSDIELPKQINDIAIVEIKKCNEGKSISNYHEIYKYAENDSGFLKEQIDIINPNIILCCNTGDAYADHLYLSEKGWGELISESKCGIWWDSNRLIIDFYHPSTRGLKRANLLFDILVKLIKRSYGYEKFSWS